jgi:hypothetical protein
MAACIFALCEQVFVHRLPPSMLPYTLLSDWQRRPPTETLVIAMREMLQRIQLPSLSSEESFPLSGRCGGVQSFCTCVRWARVSQSLAYCGSMRHFL